MAPTGPSRHDDADPSRRPRVHPHRHVHRRVVRPLQEFLQESTASGIVLLATVVVALLWVNSPVGDSYERLWRTTLSIGDGRWGIEKDLRHWVNDGLMALFFLVVGLEIKREFLTGELRDRRAAALPAIAAVAGMVMPALIYLAINAGGEGLRGWAIAMPTDIAFTLGILALASRHAPPGLRSFVLTLAIVDDILTFAVIALVYPTDVEIVPLLVAIGAGVATLGLTRLHVRVPIIVAGFGVVIWWAIHASGLPAALAGVLIAFLIPASPIRRWSEGEEVVSPLARVEHLLLPWTSFLILPLFALANAGVRLSSGAFMDAVSSRVSVGLVAGRIVGKIAGIGLATWVATRAGVARLPSEVRLGHIVGVAAAAGIAFTVSLFVTDVAFGDRTELVMQAKVGIVVCAPIAASVAYLVLRSMARSASSGPE